jgi:perosamine synthetase
MLRHLETYKETTGEGGMVLTNDAAIADRCRDLRCFGRFIHEELGWNFSMSNLQAAIGVAHLSQK